MFVRCVSELVKGALYPAVTNKQVHAQVIPLPELSQQKRIATILNDQMATDPRLILERIRRSRGRVSLTPTIRVESDPRTNSLIVSGPQRTVALAEAMIEKLDQPDEMSDRAY